jgi:hypothetical protein
VRSSNKQASIKHQASKQRASTSHFFIFHFSDVRKNSWLERDLIHELCRAKHSGPYASDVNPKRLIDLFPYIILIQAACLGEEALIAHEVLSALSAITSASSLFSVPIALN